MRTKWMCIRETILPFKFVLEKQYSFPYLACPHIFKAVMIMISYILIKYKPFKNWYKHFSRAILFLHRFVSRIWLAWHRLHTQTSYWKCFSMKDFHHFCNLIPSIIVSWAFSNLFTVSLPLRQVCVLPRRQKKTSFKFNCQAGSVLL